AELRARRWEPRPRCVLSSKGARVGRRVLNPSATLTSRRGFRDSSHQVGVTRGASPNWQYTGGASRGSSRTASAGTALGPALIGAAALIGGVTFAAPASAYDTEVSASVDAQFYTLQSPYGDPLVRRRRYTQTLGLGVYNLQGDYVPGGPQLFVRAMLRLDRSEEHTSEL